jgi:hypothetical protein
MHCQTAITAYVGRGKQNQCLPSEITYDWALALARIAYCVLRSENQVQLIHSFIHVTPVAEAHTSHACPSQMPLIPQSNQLIAEQSSTRPTDENRPKTLQQHSVAPKRSPGYPSKQNALTGQVGQVRLQHKLLAKCPSHSSSKNSTTQQH